MVYLKSEKKEDCCGCTACLAICPKTAIRMYRDNQGFLYPQIQQNKCIHCDLCTKVCHFTMRRERINPPPCYALRLKNNEDLMKSQSGGAFGAISDVILLRKGVIYGAVLESNGTVHHVRAEDVTGRNHMRKSKYVQSEMENIFQEIAKDLNAGRWVLFSGTGCQCDGLGSYLELARVPQDRLLRVDFICHGVPSPHIFHEYLEWISRKHGTEIKDFCFRDKEGKYPWASHIEKYTIHGKIHYNDQWTQLFYSNYIERPGCYVCRYTTTNRPADLTIADFWHMEEQLPDFVDSKRGTSMVLVNTDKGSGILKDVQKVAELRKATCYLQPQLLHPIKKPEDYNIFWRIYHSQGFPAVMQKYVDSQFTWKNRFKIWLGKTLMGRKFLKPIWHSLRNK